MGAIEIIAAVIVYIYRDILSVRNCSRHFTHKLIYSSNKRQEGGAVVSPTLPMRKLGLREVKLLDQGDTANALFTVSDFGRLKRKY